MHQPTYIFEKILDHILVRIERVSEKGAWSKISKLFMPEIVIAHIVVLPLHPYLMAGTRRYKIALPPEERGLATIAFETTLDRIPSVTKMSGADTVVLMFQSLRERLTYRVPLTLKHDRPYVLTRSLL